LTLILLQPKTSWTEMIPQHTLVEKNKFWVETWAWVGT
jgi:hypothetical protein